MWGGPHGATSTCILSSQATDAERQRRDLQWAIRDELLNKHAFPTIFHARAAIEAWHLDYSSRRPYTLGQCQLCRDKVRPMHASHQK